MLFFKNIIEKSSIMTLRLIHLSLQPLTIVAGMFYNKHVYIILKN